METAASLDPRLKSLADFAAERGYPYDLIVDQDGAVVQVSVPLADGNLVVLLYMAEDRVVACAPFILSVPPDLSDDTSVYRLLSALNFSSDLARYSVDPEDGEVRCIVVLPMVGKSLDVATFDLLIKAVREGVGNLGKALGEAVSETLNALESADPAKAHGTPLLN